MATGVFRVLLHEEKNPRPPAIFNLASLTMQIPPPTPWLIYNDVFKSYDMSYHAIKIAYLMRYESEFVKLIRSPGIDSQPGGIDSWAHLLQIRALTRRVVN